MEQDFDFVEILSLKISQKELYTTFCAGYGAIVGRVSVNGGFGIPNAKVSVFIPVSELDRENDKIFGLYPFETITDKGSNGLRYNLLSKDNQTNDDCFTPVGDFPDKRTFLDDDTMLDIYCEYYKFTTTSNAAGDYMIFGAPVGAQIMHVEADVSDIGIISQEPSDFIRKGSSIENFESTTKFFGSEEDLDFNLQIIKQSPISVNVQPYWGDEDSCNVAITRRDIDFKAAITPHAIFMGSIFGDNDGNAISIQCRPSKNLGTLNDQTAGSGTIQMVRKTIAGGIERFDIGGGQLIDSDGTWAYQVPMNLDYRVTDEYGDLVPTDDPKKGIPTRAYVRFRIKMDVTGGEGNLRERAAYLVPNNPLSNDNVKGREAYEFGPNTRDEDLTEFTWNSIYTVKNFIQRVQKTESPSDPKERSFLGVKDVDSARGKYTPFPYNHLNFESDALFAFICGLTIALSTIITLINATIIMIINAIIDIINWIIVIVTFGFVPDAIPYVPCISLECQDRLFAPGCCSEDSTEFPCSSFGQNSFGCEAALANNGNNVVCVGDQPDGENEWGATLPPGDAGYTNCVALSLAEDMNLFQFDFYNDWINGALYSPLFKARIKDGDTGEHKFCEWSSGGSPANMSVDNDGANGPDNDNYNDLYTIDSCWGTPDGCSNHDPECGPFDPWAVPILNKSGIKRVGSNTVRNGLIVYYDNQYYYSSALRDRDDLVLATDIVTLGSSVRCHWLGLPSIHELFVDTTYKLPPYLYVEDLATNTRLTTGMDGLSANVKHSLFFEINCFFLRTNGRTCGNIRRQCELGVGLDEIRNGIEPDVEYPKINEEDIDVRFSRSVFAWMNNNQASISLQDVYPSPFDVDVDFDAEPECGVQKGLPDYNRFRYHTYPGNAGTLCNTSPRPYDSFYFYFGLNRSKTALAKLNSKYFAPCPVKDNPDFLILGDVTSSTILCSNDVGNGAIDVTIQGGTAPFTYSWTVPYQTEQLVVPGNTEYQLDFDNGIGDLEFLCGGAYTLTVLDANGLSSTITFIVGEPQPVTCLTSVIPTSQFGAADGIINVTINYGSAPYSMNINPDPNNQYPITGLQAGTTQITGLQEDIYTITVTDVNGGESICDAVVTEPLGLSALINRDYDIGNDPLDPNDPFDPLSYLNYNSNSGEGTNSDVETTVLCYGQDSGIIRVMPFGGTSPYTVTLENGAGDTFQSTPPSGIPTAFTFGGLAVDESYIVTVEDNVGEVVSYTVEVGEPPVFEILNNNPFIPSPITASSSIEYTVAPYIVGEDITYLLYDSSGGLIESVTVTSGTYMFTGLDADTDYRIAARNGNNCFSGQLTVTTTP